MEWRHRWLHSLAKWCCIDAPSGRLSNECSNLYKRNWGRFQRVFLSPLSLRSPLSALCSLLSALCMSVDVSLSYLFLCKWTESIRTTTHRRFVPARFPAFFILPSVNHPLLSLFLLLSPPLSSSLLSSLFSFSRSLQRTDGTKWITRHLKDGIWITATCKW